MKGQIAIPGSDIFLMLFEKDIKKLNLGKSIECIVNYENKDYAEKTIKLVVKEKIINRQGKFIGEGYFVRDYPPNKFCGDVKRYNIAIDKNRFIELKEKGYIGTRRGSSRIEIVSYNKQLGGNNKFSKPQNLFCVIQNPVFKNRCCLALLFFN